MAETHSPGYTGTWLPRHIMEVYWKGGLTAKEAMLLATIDALSSSKHGKYEGCYASPEYLGKMAGMAPRNVQKAVAKFRNVGLVVQVGSNGRERFLKTAWAATTIEVYKTYTSDVYKTPPNNKANNKRVLTHSSAGGDLPAAGEGGVGTKTPKKTNMPFLPIDDKDVKGQPNEHDIARANLLRKVLTEKATTTPTWRVSLWSKQFQLLRDKDKYDDNTIATALDWYRLNIGGRFTPVVYNADDFRKKFVKVVDAMRRAGGGEPEVELNADEMEIVKDLEDCRPWPKGSKAQVRATFTRSWAAVKQFRQRLIAFRDAGKADGLVPSRKMSVDNVMQELILKLGRPEYVGRWLTGCSNRVKGWDAWSGNLLQMAWTPGDELFQKEALAIDVEFSGGKGEAWKWLWSALNEN